MMQQTCNQVSEGIFTMEKTFRVYDAQTRHRHCKDSHWYGRDTDVTHKNEVSNTGMQVSDTETLPRLKCPCNIVETAEYFVNI